MSLRLSAWLRVECLKNQQTVGEKKSVYMRSFFFSVKTYHWIGGSDGWVGNRVQVNEYFMSAYNETLDQSGVAGSEWIRRSVINEFGISPVLG